MREKLNEENSGTWSFIVKPTSVYRQPSSDFIAIMRNDDMDKLDVKENDYVLVRNKVRHDIFSWDDIDDDFEKNRIIKYVGSLFGLNLKNKQLVVDKVENTITISGKIDPITISLEQNNQSGNQEVIIRIENKEPKKLQVERNKEGKLMATIVRWLEIRAHLIGIKHDLSKMENKLEPGEIGIDQTYREALGLEVGEKVDIKKTNAKYGFKERLLTSLNYQKAVVRVQQNAPYMESKTPVACICEEIVNSIGAQYGDMISVEARGKKINVKCAKLSPFMTEFHDSIIGTTLSQDEIDVVSKKYENTYLKNPFNLITKWGRVTEKRGEMIHPFFTDLISRNILNVNPLDPVKIRKSLSWQIQKKINTFGGLAILAIAILIPEIISITNGHPELNFLWIIMIPLIVYVIWSVFTSSKYQTNIEG